MSQLSGAVEQWLKNKGKRFVKALGFIHVDFTLRHAVLCFAWSRMLVADNQQVRLRWCQVTACARDGPVWTELN